MDNMEEQLLELIGGMKDEGFDFYTTPAMFKWRYHQYPDVELTLIMKGYPVRDESSIIEGTDSTLQ